MAFVREKEREFLATSLEEGEKQRSMRSRGSEREGIWGEVRPAMKRNTLHLEPIISRRPKIITMRFIDPGQSQC